MGRPPRELTPWESALNFFGAELRHWRTVRDLSQARLGLLTHDSGTLISKIEKGERFPSRDFARRMDEALDTEGVLTRLWPQVEAERAARTAPARTPTHSDESMPTELGLVWSGSTAATVKVVGTLWRADMERRSVLLSAAWVAAAFAEPVRQWLLNRTDEVFEEQPGRRTVGQADIDVLWSMCETFTDSDQRLGGGYAHSTLLHYVNQVVLPLLNGSYNEAIGRELMSATARLCDLCGWMSFDSGRHGLAQRYFIQALRLAHAGENRVLGAHILGDMSTQAHHFGIHAKALELATLGYESALDGGAPSTAARCAALQARAHALRGDHRACAQACTIAERTLDRAAPSDERTWVKTFTAELLTADRLYMADDLGRVADVQRIAPEALASSGGMARRQVLCTTVLAASHLPAEGNPHSDLDRACELLGQVLPSLGSLHSARSVERFNTVRRALTAHAERPSVREFEARFRTTVVAAGTP